MTLQSLEVYVWSLRNKKKSKNAEYRPVLHVFPNSNICERLFSGNKLVMSDQRKSMDPSTIETVTMLDQNSDLWDARRRSRVRSGGEA